MHDAMAARVMRAPVGWFERTPLGRILNRFSSDIQEVDKDVMDGLGSTLACAFSAFSIIVVISYTVRWGVDQFDCLLRFFARMWSSSFACASLC